MAKIDGNRTTYKGKSRGRQFLDAAIDAANPYSPAKKVVKAGAKVVKKVVKKIKKHRQNKKRTLI